MKEKIRLTPLERYWVLYDIGNSAFILLATTLIPIFFNSLANGAGLNESQYLAYWGYAGSVATLLVALIGPICGTLADHKGFKKPIFMICMLMGALGCAALGLSWSWLSFLAFFVIAKVGFSSSVVFYDAMLPEITTDERMDTVSSCGFAYGYIGSVIPFVVCLALVLGSGFIGLSQTLQQLRAAGIEPMGAYANDQDYRSSKGYSICNVQGIRVAFVAFTKGLGGMGLPAGNENCVNLLYEDYDSTYKTVDTKKINTILDNVAAEKPDLVVAMLHWGSENSENITTSQEKIITLLQKKGVDVILGTHPHLLQKITFDQSAGTLVAYSLGDFLSDAAHDGTNYSIILDVEITKYADSGVTQVTGFSYVPIYTATDTECIAIRQEGARRVLRIREAMSAYEGNFVDRITADAYAKMQYALTRIEERIQGKSQTTTTK